MTDYVNGQQIQNGIAGILGEVNKRLADFLEEVLPALSGEWWKSTVLKNLSVPQTRHLEQQKIDSLGKMDLSALLRVLDKNWYEVSNRLKLPRETLHYLKEMQTIRNRWAHVNAEGYPIEDIYRDLDTIQRFATGINADNTVIEEIRAFKKTLRDFEGGTGSVAAETNSRQEQAIENNGFEFTVGEIVCLKSDPGKKGVVVSVQPSEEENRYTIFMDGDTKPFYASQLMATNTPKMSVETISCEHFHAYLSALQIRHPSLSTLYSLNAARVDFIPYQFRPVLRFIRSDRPRLLIADGVGVGKTIEAGLILRELQARRDIRSILIICPRPLVTEKKWLNEMKRFEERFTHLDGPTLRYCINEMDLDGVWPEQHQRVILPYSLLDEALLHGSDPNRRGKCRKGLLQLDPPPRFDLVIVDEAHHIRNTNTHTHKAVRFFCDHAEAVVFLTATPIQLGDQDLFVLLNTLRPDIIIDPESYRHMAEPNPHINEAAEHVRSSEADWPNRAIEAMDQAAETAWGRAILSKNPVFIRTRERLEAGNLTLEERVQVITDIEGMHSFANIINRTRRRDIGDFTIRRPETVAVEFTPPQRELHDELLRIQSEIYANLHGWMNVKFMMTTIRRQAASCLYGLVPLLKEILNRHVDRLAWDEMDAMEDEPDPDAVAPVEDRIRELLDKSQDLDPHDPKLEALRQVLRSRQDRANNKVMLFSSFRHTLRYLLEHLDRDGFRVGLIMGDTHDEERMVLRKRFESPRENPDALDVLLFSEIGCEGLDYQFCDCMVNYDLPWNPMRIEQRIGRIDRKGQKSESVAIINMVTPGTVDAEIYERCLVRIGIFNQALGGSEEILGDITRKIQAIGMDPELTESECKSKLQQLADNQVRTIQEQEKLEEQQKEFFGLRLPEDRMKKDIEDASSFWLSPASIQRLVSLYIRQQCGREQEFILGEQPLKTLRLSTEARKVLLDDFRKLPRQGKSDYREWENWLKGGEPHLSITFESDCAMENPKAAFIMPIHPLVRQAAIALDTENRITTVLWVKDQDVPPGRYEFALYQWRFQGIRDDLTLKPVTACAEITARLTQLLEKAEDMTGEGLDDDITARWDALDTHHHALWAEARKRHAKQTRELAEFRRESLATSHQARIALLDEQLANATHANIQRMRQSQIASAEADYARRLQELGIAMERADLIAEPVAYGIIIVKRKIQSA